jgi:very-short-patch-repair endonuclease
MAIRQQVRYPKILNCKVDNTTHTTHHSFIFHLKKLNVTQQEYYDNFLIKDNSEKLCNNCSKPVDFISIKYGYKNFCSHQCSVRDKTVSKNRSENTKKALFEKYGVSNASQIPGWREKCKQTSMERYGDEHYVNSEKAKQTNLERYGGHFTNTDEYKALYKNTVLVKYGVDHHTKSPKVKEKIKKTNIDRYGVSSYLSIEAIKKTSSLNKMKSFYSFINEYCKLNNLQHDITIDNFIKDSKNRNFSLQCLLCNNEFSVNWKSSHVTPKCSNCFRPQYVSKWETEVKEFIENDLGIKIQKNVRFYEGSVLYEADILVEDHKLIIECDGVYRHGENNGNRDKNYHINKNKFFNAKGYSVIHILDYEWNQKQDIVKSRLMSKLNKINKRIGARKLNIKLLSSKDARNFIEENHIKGFVPAKYHVGLVGAHNIIYSVLSISTRGRVGISGTGVAEIIRFCNKKYWNVNGSFSKLFNFALNHVDTNLKNQKIVSYTDVRWSDNVTAYEHCNFNKKRYTSPSYWYIKSGKVYHRTQFMKHLLKSKLQKYNEEMTEYENMLLNGYDRYWDCGEIVYEYN